MSSSIPGQAAAERFFQKNPLTRNVCIVVSVVIIIAFFMSTGVQSSKTFGIPRNVLFPPMIVLVLFAGLLLLLSLGALGAGTEQRELEAIIERRKQLEERVAAGKETDVFDAFELSVNQLNEYYTINRTQAQISFRTSILSVGVGFLTISIGIWIAFVPNIVPDPDRTALTTLASVSVASGIILEFIGGAYFYLYNRSLTQFNFFFSRLVMAQDTMVAVRLCLQIQNERDRSKVIERLIFAIISNDKSYPVYNSEGLPASKPPRSRKVTSDERNAREGQAPGAAEIPHA